MAYWVIQSEQIGCLTPHPYASTSGAPTCHHHQGHRCHQSPGMPEQHWVNLGTPTTPNHPLGEFPTENTVREVGTTKSCCHLVFFHHKWWRSYEATRLFSRQTLRTQTQNHTLWMQGAQPRWLETTWFWEKISWKAVVQVICNFQSLFLYAGRWLHWGPNTCKTSVQQQRESHGIHYSNL